MTEPITPIDANAELRSQIVDVVRSALRPDARPLEATPAPGTTTAENTPPPGRKAEDARAAAAERKAEGEAEACRNLALPSLTEEDRRTLPFT